MQLFSNEIELTRTMQFLVMKLSFNNVAIINKG